jgi:hypothetical protein
MVPLYAARIEDLGPGDFVKAGCIACGHDELIPASALLQGLRLPPTYRVLDSRHALGFHEVGGAKILDVSGVEGHHRLRWVAGLFYNAAHGL